MNNFEHLTDFAKKTLDDRYTLPNERYFDIFARVAKAYGDNADHSERLYCYMQKGWFMPATPILSNGGTTRGLPISCFVNEVDDSLQSIANTWTENVWLAAKGGGIGTYWGNVRGLGEPVSNRGDSSGTIPFIAVQNALTLAVSQGSLRRGSSAAYMPVSHPEIEEFIGIRKPTGGDINRKALNMHHGVVVSDAFMNAVEKGMSWDLRSPVDGKVIHTINARDLWIQIITTRLETGEPYLMFGDTANRLAPDIYKRQGLKVKTSNLCSEIMLHTGLDQQRLRRTAVCCLASVNLEYFDAWRRSEIFIADIMRFLDNVLQGFIDSAPDTMKNARYSAYRERSIGLGAMGFHSLLQKKRITFDSAEARILNKNMFRHIREKADESSVALAKEREPCLDAEAVGIYERFTHKLAIAPNATTSVINNCSPGVEPYLSNAYTQKTLSGSFPVRNKILEQLLEEKGRSSTEVWRSIVVNEGSVQHLDFLDESEKLVFRTAFEIPQEVIIDLAADRTPYICQGQSINLYFPADINKKILHQIHFSAWKKGLKSLYYCRSKSLQRAEKVSSPNFECTACQ